MLRRTFLAAASLACGIFKIREESSTTCTSDIEIPYTTPPQRIEPGCFVQLTKKAAKGGVGCTVFEEFDGPIMKVTDHPSVTAHGETYYDHTRILCEWYDGQQWVRRSCLYVFQVTLIDTPLVWPLQQPEHDGMVFSTGATVHRNEIPGDGNSTVFMR